MNKRNPINPGVEQWRRELLSFSRAIEADNLPDGWSKQLDVHMYRLRLLDQKLKARPLKYTDLFIIGIASHLYKSIFDSLRKHKESAARADECQAEASTLLPCSATSVQLKCDLLTKGYAEYVKENKSFIMQDIAALIERTVFDRTHSKTANCTPADFAQAYIRTVSLMYRNTAVITKKGEKELKEERIGYCTSRYILFLAMLNRENPYTIVDFSSKSLSDAVGSIYPSISYAHLLFDKVCKLNVLKALASADIMPNGIIKEIVDTLKKSIRTESGDAKMKSYRYLLDQKDYASDDVKDIYEDILHDIYSLDFISRKIYDIIPKGKLNTEGYNKRLVFNIIGLLCDHNILYPKKSPLGNLLNNTNKKDFLYYLKEEEGDNAQLTADEIRAIEDKINSHTGKDFTVLEQKNTVVRLKSPKTIITDLSKIGIKKQNLRV